MERIYIEPFDVNIYLVTTPRQANNLIDKADEEVAVGKGVYGEVYTLTIKGSKKIILFVNKRIMKNRIKKDKHFLVRTVAHESLHAAIKVYDLIGSELESNLEEPVAYLMDYILGKVLNHLDS